MSKTANPYAAYLGDRDALTVLAETPAHLTERVQAIGPSGLQESYAPGKWTGETLLAHLADCEIAFGNRWRQAFADPTIVVQPFDQDLWAKQYPLLDKSAAFDIFIALRRWNVAWLKSLPAEAFAIEVTHPERGLVSLQTLLNITAGHDLNHMQHFDLLAAKTGSRL
jgi:DinB superfamily